MVAALLAMPVSSASAGTVYLTTVSDPTGAGVCSYSNAPSGSCSLRQAIAFATAGDTVSLQAPSPAGTYLLTQDQLGIAKNITIAGAGPQSTIISGGGVQRVIDIDPTGLGGNVTVSVSGVTITGGNAQGASDAPGSGGGILVHGANDTLTLTGSEVDGNTTGPGSGVNTYGGGIDSVGTLNLARDTIAANTSIGTSTLGGFGGGISAIGPLNATNVTVAGNNAGSAAGGDPGSGGGLDLELHSGQSAVLANVTLTGNTAVATSPSAGGAGGNLFDGPQGSLTFKNTIIAAGSTPSVSGHENCYITPGAAVIANDFNLEGTAAPGQCQLALAGTDQAGAAVNLGQLQDNGGPTRTIALLPGSAAIDSNQGGGCTDASGGPLTVDQRGVPRLAAGDPNCDAGAFELGTSDLAITAGAVPSPVTVGGLLTYELSVTNNGPALVGGVSLTDPLPAGVAISNVIASAGSCTSGATVSCALGTLAPFASASVTIVVRTQSTGVLVNSPSTTAVVRDPSLSNNQVAINSTVLKAPVVSRASERNQVWRVGRSRARISQGFRAARAVRPPVGTAFNFTVNEPATVQLAFSTAVGGRKVGGRCVAQTSSNRHLPRCTRNVSVGMLTFSGARPGVRRSASRGACLPPARSRPAPMWSRSPRPTQPAAHHHRRS